MVEIRRLQESDRSEWLRLRQALWPTPYYELDAQIKEMDDLWADQDQQPVFVAARSDGGLCGMLEVSIRKEAPGCKTDRIGYLEGWYVDDDMRQQGIGKQLVDAAETWAKSQGCTEMASDTDENYPTSPVAHVALGYTTTEIYFRKDLT